jgi:hypothetical protein
MAWMEAGGFVVEVEKAMKFIMSRCEAGKFGGT